MVPSRTGGRAYLRASTSHQPSREHGHRTPRKGCEVGRWKRCHSRRLTCPSIGRIRWGRWVRSHSMGKMMAYASLGNRTVVARHRRGTSGSEGIAAHLRDTWVARTAGKWGPRRFGSSSRLREEANLGAPWAWRLLSAFWERGYPDLPACGPGLARFVYTSLARNITALNKALVRGQASRGGAASRPARRLPRYSSGATDISW